MTDTALQQKRLIAAVIDIAVCIGVVFGVTILSLGVQFALGFASGTAAGVAGRLFNLLASLAVFAYILGRDVLLQGRSLGKKTQDLKVVGASGGPVTLEESARRNALFGIGSTLGAVAATLQLVPCLGDAVTCLLMPLWVLGILFSFVAAIVEIVMIIQDPAGIRMGDKFARTRVVRA
jgi:uncharacterized RDD family membrane protein YckC